jgi:hypothetical protein
MSEFWKTVEIRGNCFKMPNNEANFKKMAKNEANFKKMAKK